MQTAVVWSCLPFIRSGQNHLARHSERGNKTRQTEEEVGRQHQGMDRPGDRQVPEGSGEQGKMEGTVAKSSVVPQRPLRLRDWWWWWGWKCPLHGWKYFAATITACTLQNISWIGWRSVFSCLSRNSTWYQPIRSELAFQQWPNCLSSVLQAYHGSRTPLWGLPQQQQSWQELLRYYLSDGQWYDTYNSVTCQMDNDMTSQLVFKLLITGF